MFRTHGHVVVKKDPRGCYKVEDVDDPTNWLLVSSLPPGCELGEYYPYEFDGEELEVRVGKVN